MGIEQPLSMAMMLIGAYAAIFIICAVAGFIVVMIRGRKGEYRVKLHDDRKEIEDHFNGYQPSGGSQSTRPPSDE